MDSNYSIEPIREDHIEGYCAAVDVVARERKYLAFLEGPPLEMSREFVRSNMETGNPHFVVIAGQTVVGWCDIVRNRSRPVAIHSGALGTGLLPPFRHRGIGRKLLAAAIAATWRTDMTRIELTVRADNRNATALYESLGFMLEGTHRAAMRIDGQYFDLLSMALLKNGIPK